MTRPTLEQDRKQGGKWSVLAHVVPFLVFMVFVSIPGWLPFQVDNNDLAWWVHSPEQIIYPIQTLVVLGLLIYFWRFYTFPPHRGLILATLLGVVGIAFWLLPEWLYHQWGVQDWKPGPRINIPFVIDTKDDGNWQLLGLAKRDEGFDPTFIKEAGNHVLYWLAVLFRFLRMVVVVALVEEIFWRGFLQRYLVNPDRPFWKTPFGTHSWKAYLLTTLFFTLVHHPVDWLACIVFGSLVYWISIRTKSLTACVVAHAVANLLLGLYTMIFSHLHPESPKWGFW